MSLRLSLCVRKPMFCVFVCACLCVRACAYREDWGVGGGVCFMRLYVRALLRVRAYVYECVRVCVLENLTFMSHKCIHHYPLGTPSATS